LHLLSRSALATGGRGYHGQSASAGYRINLLTLINGGLSRCKPVEIGYAVTIGPFEQACTS
jgi:hypothetical protein